MANLLDANQPKRLAQTGTNAGQRQSDIQEKPEIEGAMEEYDNEDNAESEPEEESRWTS